MYPMNCCFLLMSLVGLGVRIVLMEETGSSGNQGLYNVDRNEISVSGFSPGGAMAIQFHVAFSSMVKGVGSFAGIPYDCSNGNLYTALSCMFSPSDINVETLAQRAENLANAGKIDKTKNLENARVFVWVGSEDDRVYPGASDKIEEFYQQYTNHVKYVKTNGGAHNMPTKNYGPSCDYSGPPFIYISNCGYDGAYEALNYIHGDLIRPRTGFVNLQGEFMEFNQTELALISGTNGPADLSESIDSVGFAYIPSGCLDKSKACKLHVAFHGCWQGRVYIGDLFAQHAGYNDVAELNDIIILYPQAIPHVSDNPNGCWDWWGYESPHFNNKNGKQMKAVLSMILHFAGK